MDNFQSLIESLTKLFVITMAVKLSSFSTIKVVPKTLPNIPQETEQEKNERIIRLNTMFSPERLKKIKNKELRRFKRSQNKKWENWLNAVSK